MSLAFVSHLRYRKSITVSLTHPSTAIRKLSPVMRVGSAIVRRTRSFRPELEISQRVPVLSVLVPSKAQAILLEISPAMGIQSMSHAPSVFEVAVDGKGFARNLEFGEKGNNQIKIVRCKPLYLHHNQACHTTR
jgi:hypothetical protein